MYEYIYDIMLFVRANSHLNALYKLYVSCAFDNEVYGQKYNFSLKRIIVHNISDAHKIIHQFVCEFNIVSIVFCNLTKFSVKYVLVNMLITFLKF